MRWTSKCDGIKRNEIVPFKETWMNLETVIQSEESQKNKYRIISLICGIKKKWYKWTYLLSKNKDTEVENKLMETKRERWSEMTWKIGIDTYALCTMYGIDNWWEPTAEHKEPRSSTQCPMGAWGEQNPKKRACMCTRSWFTLLCSRN